MVGMMGNMAPERSLRSTLTRMDRMSSIGLWKEESCKFIPLLNFRKRRKIHFFDWRRDRGWSDGQPGPNKGCSKGKRGWKWVKLLVLFSFIKSTNYSTTLYFVVWHLGLYNCVHWTEYSHQRLTSQHRLKLWNKWTPYQCLNSVSPGVLYLPATRFHQSPTLR